MRVSVLTRREIEQQIPHINQRLFSAGRMLGQSPEDLEDLIAATWVTFFEKLSDFRGDSKLSTFIFGIFYNKHRSRYRKKRPEPIPDESFDHLFDEHGLWATPMPQPEATVLSLETRGRLQECIEGLGEKHQKVFLLKHVVGETSEEICKILGVTVTHLGVLLFRAKNQLRKCLETKADGITRK